MGFNSAFKGLKYGPSFRLVVAGLPVQIHDLDSRPGFGNMWC